MITIIERIPEKLSGRTSFFLFFDYNEEINNIIKNCSTYSYSKKNKCWEIPAIDLSYILDSLTYFDNIKLVLMKDENVRENIEKPILSYKIKPFKHQEEAIQYGLNHNSWLLLDAPGLGKAFSLDTPILTVSGYKKMKDIKVNDILFDEQGKKCNVTATYNHESLNMYKVTFTTGESVTCCEDHLWYFIDSRFIWHKDTKKYTQEDIPVVYSIKDVLSLSKSHRNVLRIPFCKPVQFDKKQLPLDPYILGCLLGDGHIGYSAAITSADIELINEINRLLPENYQCIKIKNSKYGYNIVDVNDQTIGKRNKIKNILEQLNLIGTHSDDKFIPDLYKYSDINDRIAILQGLLDTDGTCSAQKSYKGSKSNSVQFSTTSSRLKDDIEFLVNSLGGYITSREYIPYYFNKKYNEKRNGKKSYTISIHMPDNSNLFRLSRKKERVGLRVNKPRRKIKDIEYIGKMPGKCITVDSPNSLYLADKCIVTHNTFQMIALAEELKAQRNIEHCLIICGIATLRANWEKEIKKYSDLSYITIGKRINSRGTITWGSLQDRANQLKEKINEFFVIINVESLIDDRVLEAINNSKNNFDMIVFDEVHKCKGFHASRSKNLLNIEQGKYRIGLSGTLIMNNALDSYIPLRWIGVEHSTLTNFKNLYCKFGGFGGHEIVGFKNLDLLKDELENCSLRRTKDLMDLPPKNVIDEIVEMSDKHRKFYEDVKKGVKEECDKIELKANNILALTTRLRQATSCPSVLTSNDIVSSKIERCVDLVEDIVSQGDKVVIMSTFKEPVYQLRELLKQYNPLIGTGDMKDADVSDNIDKFQTDNKYKVFIGTTSKMGTGVTLNAAKYMICVDEAWTAALQEQVEDRIHRINNTEPVFIYNLICENTIDETVSRIISRKKAMSQFIVDDKIDDDALEILKKYIEEL